jgi:hypothetical protein
MLTNLRLNRAASTFMSRTEYDRPLRSRLIKRNLFGERFQEPRAQASCFRLPQLLHRSPNAG